MFAGSRHASVKRSGSVTRDTSQGGELLSEADAAANIQALWRGKQARKEVADKMKAKEEEARKVAEESAAAFERKVPEHWCYPADIQMTRYRLYNLFEEPGSSFYAQILSIVILVTIVFSIICFMLETMPELRSTVQESDWTFIEKFCTAIFTVEYVIRFWVCDVLRTQTKLEFLRSPMNVFDLLAILPVYLELLMAQIQVPALRVFRAVRLIRLTRIFKLGRYSTGMRVMVEALRNSFQALGVLIFFLCIGVVLFSSCMYYAEQSFCPTSSEMTKEDLEKYRAECNSPFNHGGTSSYGLCCDEYDSPNDFSSIIDTFWWSFVTMTTVGFGDEYPRTWLGKVVGTFSMLSGILIIALPVAIVGRKFQEIYEQYAGEEKPFAGHGVTAMLKAKSIQVEAISLPKTPMYGMSNRIRTLRLSSEALHMGEELRELAGLFDEADEHAAQMYRMEMVEAYRQDEMQRKFEQLLGSVIEAATGKAVKEEDPSSPLSRDPSLATASQLLNTVPE